MPDDFDPASVSWVLNRSDLNHLIAAIEACDEAVVDLETTGLDEHARTGGLTNAGFPARIVLASLTLPTRGDTNGMPTTWVMPLSHPNSPWLSRWPRVCAEWAQAILDNEKPLLNQNLKFDCRWVFAHTGVDLSSRLVWDTLVSSHLLDENASTRLKERAPATFGVSRWDDFDLTKPGAAESVPMFDLGMYAARDTYWTWRLACAHRDRMYLSGDDAHTEPDSPDEVENARLGRLAVWCAMPTQATLTSIEQRGIGLDTDWVRDALVRDQDTVAELSTQLAERYGMEPAEASFAPTSIWFQDWAAKVVDAGDLIVAALTPTGRPQWSKGVLVRQFRNGSEVAGDLLTLRGAVKRAEYLTSWLRFVTPAGLIHCTYNYGRVVTGRLSSSEPNMQQVTAALKPAFVPRPGFVLADFDYSQIELRIAAFISRCEPMLAAFRRGDDLHLLLASRITGKDPVLVTPAERHGGKSANFGLLYGMQANGFREYAETVYGVSFTPEEAQLIHRTFFETWDGIGAWHAKAVSRVQRTGQVTSPIGRVRRLPDIWDGNDFLASAAERAAINAPVQGFASDIMQMAAASIEGRLPGVEPVRDAGLVGTVHDSILAEVPEDDWEMVALACQDRMLTIGEHLKKLDCDLDVPLAAEVKVGTRWGLADVGHL